MISTIKHLDALLWKIFLAFSKNIISISFWIPGIQIQGLFLSQISLLLEVLEHSTTFTLYHALSENTDSGIKLKNQGISKLTTLKLRSNCISYIFFHSRRCKIEKWPLPCHPLLIIITWLHFWWPFRFEYHHLASRVIHNISGQQGFSKIQLTFK